MILLLPNVFAIGSMAVICATGIPVLSISLVIAAPQRVHDPQVETNRTASILFLCRLSAIDFPNNSPFLKDAPVPVVL